MSGGRCRAFAEKTLVAAGQCTKIEGDREPEQFAAVGPLGCGGMAVSGAAINTPQCGAGSGWPCCAAAVSAPLPAGATLAGATTVIGVDLDDAKLATAQDFGATHTVNARGQDPAEAIWALTGWYGVDVVIDAVGIAVTFQQAFEARDLAGRVVLVGVPDPGT